nr:protein YgfX [Bowmanella yangjiangensis]
MLVLYCLLIASVWLWQPSVLPWQTVWQMLVSLVLLGLFYRQVQMRPEWGVANVSERGEWQWLNNHSVPMQITSDSRATSWLLFICLQDVLDSKQHRYLCIFRDAVSEADYRRLCRILSQGIS